MIIGIKMVNQRFKCLISLIMWEWLAAGCLAILIYKPLLQFVCFYILLIIFFCDWIDSGLNPRIVHNPALQAFGILSARPDVVLRTPGKDFSIFCFSKKQFSCRVLFG